MKRMTRLEALEFAIEQLQRMSGAETEDEALAEFEEAVKVLSTIKKMFPSRAKKKK